MRVGILIPTCDRIQFLEKALASVMAQTHTEIEIIVIDNGKDDAAQNLVEGLNDSRVRYIRNEQNIFLIGSIRKGMQLFSDAVTWVTILPDDDLLDQGFIESMVDYVELNSQASVIHGHWTIINAEGEKTGEAQKPSERVTALQYLIGRSMFIHQTFLCGLFLRRSSYQEIGEYPEFTSGMATDDAMIFALSLTDGLHFNHLAKASVRMYPGAESHSSKNVTGHIQALDDFRGYIWSKSVDQNTFSSKELEIIRKSLDYYVRESAGGLWLRRVQELQMRKVVSSHCEMQELCGLVKTNPLNFPVRVRLDGFIIRFFNWNPETSKSYGTFWSGLRKIALHRKRKSWLRNSTTGSDVTIIFKSNSAGSVNSGE